MRLSFATLALMLTVAPVLGATQQDHDDCNALDADRNIAGCTRVIEDSTESATVRGIAHVGRGLALLGKGDRTRAAADMTDAIRFNPNDSLAYSNRGLIRRDTDDLDGALADLTEAIRLDPLPRSELPGIPRVNVYSNRGTVWQAKGDMDRALADFDEAIRRGGDLTAFYRRAEIRTSMDQYEEAAADLEQALRIDPDNSPSYYLRGVIRFELYTRASPWIRREDLEGAIADFGEVIRRNPEWGQGHYARGLAKRTNGDKDGAIADLMEAARLDPTTPDIIAALKHLKPDYESAEDTLGKYFKWPGSAEQTK